MSGHFTPGNRWFAYGNLAAAMVIVGSSVVVGKIMVTQLPVFLASALRFAIALAVLVPLMYLREGHALPRLSGRNWRILGLQSLFGSFLFTTFLLYGLGSTSPAAAGIITSTTPAWIGLIAWLAMGERPLRRGVAGIACALCGVLLINLAAPAADGPGSGAVSLAGNLLVIAAVICESLFLLMRKGVDQPLSALAASTAISAFGFAWFLPAGIVQAVGFDFAAIGPAAWFSVLYYGLVVTIVAYLCWFAGIMQVDAATAGVFTGLMPVSAVALSMLVLEEPLTLPKAVGCGLALAGIMLISFARRSVQHASCFETNR
ncbi:EamA/RhaT family transporter [Oceanidesulfovibrio indonesiensis]|uniref:EamA/RhaT family transporter n=1 Tax=Oceanidesulfovibrio indonesiensis TaxID=54767 RepID=A0A7M3MAV6_9BACT|nr:DMT family transporter [Oceanidesulfovibrio indonesiensis]TVM14351.1 EamA/RhaT family transporter [Oceanidesulfovibrio indonesiensis]